MKKLTSVLSVALAVWVVKYSAVINQKTVACSGSQPVQISTNVFQSQICTENTISFIESKFKSKDAADEYAEIMTKMGAINVRVIKK
jgi:hypothetical protein